MVTLPARMGVSAQELDWIAWAAGLAAFPGVSVDEVSEAADGVVVEGLIARELLSHTSGELVLREDMAALLGAVLACDVSLDVRTFDSSGEFSVVLHLRQEVAIAQRVTGGIVSFLVVPPGRLPATLLAFCGQDATLIGDGHETLVRVEHGALEAIERGDVEPGPMLSGYVASARAPERTGMVAARGTLYGEPHASCAWVSGAGGTYVVRRDGDDAEIVRADGSELVWQLLRLVGPAPSTGSPAAGH